LAELNPKTGAGDRPVAEDPGQQMVQAEVVLDDREAPTAYANFARVNTTPEEVIIDFALNPNPFRTGKQEVKVNHRLIMNYYTAKRLCSVLVATLQRLEATFGPIELDFRRRAQGQSPPGTPGVK
jgi:hypothetical protein